MRAEFYQAAFYQAAFYQAAFYQAAFYQAAFYQAAFYQAAFYQAAAQNVPQFGTLVNSRSARNSSMSVGTSADARSPRRSAGAAGVRREPSPKVSATHAAIPSATATSASRSGCTDFASPAPRIFVHSRRSGPSIETVTVMVVRPSATATS